MIPPHLAAQLDALVLAGTCSARAHAALVRLGDENPEALEALLELVGGSPSIEGSRTHIGACAATQQHVRRPERLSPRMLAAVPLLPPWFVSETFAWMRYL